MLNHPKPDDQAWVLDSVFLGPDRRYRPAGSLILGLLGPFLFAVVSCLAVGLLVLLMESSGARGTVVRATGSLVGFLLASGGYFATVLALHLYASCELPITIRLVLIYITLFACWSAAIWPLGDPVTPIQVIASASICAGGFMLRRLRGWRALSWKQQVTQPRLTIFSLLDVTTAIAITFGLISLDTSSFEPRGLACMMTGLMVIAAVGLHVWTRLISLCPFRHDAAWGFGIWMAINILWAFLVFVSFAVAVSSSPVGLLGFLAAPGTLLVAYVWTEIPLRWLRGCGWTMIRTNDSKHESLFPNANQSMHEPVVASARPAEH